MNYTDARDGLHIRFSHHDGTRAGGKAAPVFRLRPALTFTHAEDGTATASTSGWDRVVVAPHPPYARGAVLPFTPSNASQFVECAATKPTPRAKRNDVPGSRRRTR